MHRAASYPWNAVPGAGGAGGDPAVCGAMTSGGTESILSAVKASRDYMRARRGIREPEMIIANSAHAAFFKAADFFKIRPIQVSLGRKCVKRSNRLSWLERGWIGLALSARSLHVLCIDWLAVWPFCSRWSMAVP